MTATKRIADVGYRLFSGSMMLLTVYGGYLCAMRGYRYQQRQKLQNNVNQDSDVLKD